MRLISEKNALDSLVSRYILKFCGINLLGFLATTADCFPLTTYKGLRDNESNNVDKNRLFLVSEIISRRDESTKAMVVGNFENNVRGTLGPKNVLTSKNSSKQVCNITYLLYCYIQYRKDKTKFR